MKKLFTLLAAALCSLTATAQVNTDGLTSEPPVDGQRFYLVCDNGYFVTTKGSTVITSTIAPDDPEWRLEKKNGSWVFHANGSNCLDWDSPNNIIYLSSNPKTWDIKNNAFRKGCYTISADVLINFFGDEFPDNDFIYIDGEGTTITGWPSEYGVTDKSINGSSMDFLFFQTLPAEIDNRSTGGGEEEEEEEIDIEPNDIEGDFQANWAKSMQDAKVLTYAPMDNKSVYIQPWSPYRKGVSSFNYVIYREDVVSQFYGNKVKNLWFMLPPNAAEIQFFVMDPMEQDPEKSLLWSDYYDFTETVNHIIAKPNGLKEHWIGADEEEEDVAGKGTFYGYDLNLNVKDPDDPYYKCNQVVGIPCDFTITKDHPNLQIGYTIVYPGEYKENYKNGRDEKGGLKDGYWYSCSYLLPTSRPYYAFMSGDDDPDWHNGRVEDYTPYTSSLMSQYQWTTYASLFCYVETEGQGGFPHNDIRFDAVKSSRCYAGDSKVAFNTTFTNYGVDAIKSATFDVTVGENTQKIRFKDGIRFLEQANLNDDIKAPAEPSRQRLQIKVSKINGKDVDIASDVNGSIIAVNENEDVDRMPVIEENTGTWCGWCPRGLVGMEMLREKYGENIALIGIHTGQDQKSNYMMDDVVATFGATAAPSCIVNRLYTCDPYGGTSNGYFGIKDDVDAVRRQITEATIGFDKVVRSKDGQHIALQTSTTFNIDCAYCPYLLTYVLAEDDLQYAQQMNYFTSQVDAATKDLYKKNAPELYELTQKPANWRPIYNDVMEYCAEGLGLEGSLTGAIVKGEAKQHSFAFDVPRYTTGKSLVTDLDNCRLIALLLDAESMEIVNAAQIRMEDAIVSDDDPLFTGVGTVLRQQTTDNGRTYDLQGRPAATSHGAILVKNGKKVIL